MKKPHRTGRRPHSLRRFCRLFLEPLEDRVLLDASNIFARFSGILNNPGEVQRIPLAVTSADFTPAGSAVIMGLELQAAPGSSLDPAAVQITNSAGATIAPRYSAADLANNTQSLNLAGLPLGNYSLAIRGDRGTTGAFQLSIFLAGEVDGTFKVDTTDGNTIRNIIGSVAGDGHYMVEADSNLDGVISSFDYTQWRANLSAATTVRPLFVTLQLPPGLITLPDGSPVAGSANVIVFCRELRVASREGTHLRSSAEIRRY